eukprot:6190736-Pleurochrysis_carterae.AAC.1
MAVNRARANLWRLGQVLGCAAESRRQPLLALVAGLPASLTCWLGSASGSASSMCTVFVGGVGCWPCCT